MTSDSGLIRVSADMVKLKFYRRMGLEDYLAGRSNGEETHDVITWDSRFRAKLPIFYAAFPLVRLN